MTERMTDEELLLATAKARRAAHDAPKADRGNPNDTWARRSNEWMTLANEVHRRGLPQPDLHFGASKRTEDAKP